MAAGPQVGGFTVRSVEGFAQEQSVRDGSVTRENEGFVAPGQSALSVCGRYAVASGALTIPLHSVPAGKVWYITDIQISFDTTSQYDIQIQSGTVSVFRQVVKGDTAPCEMPGMATQTAILPGQTANLVIPTVGGATNFDFTIAGFQQDVGVG